MRNIWFHNGSQPSANLHTYNHFLLLDWHSKGKVQKSVEQFSDAPTLSCSEVGYGSGWSEALLWFPQLSCRGVGGPPAQILQSAPVNHVAGDCICDRLRQSLVICIFTIYKCFLWYLRTGIFFKMPLHTGLKYNLMGKEKVKLAILNVK